ncbi:hypothetical protein CfE428DRAFT_5757 [Chthoniobacter flavus Ellin428]|uniref:Uncharacterized protein n=1 Tax=Chthoniobacter flavus Ellin428 TaxID=497964 RepID=B4DA17_9BACT|nr:hypothetical protein [Chthoniobacter flavus]EDY16644.1 hypothetical protein CfE428DRAFT_5757 [Chthoniobacter flavus Ellin428]TCO87219.1 hypothetical protein EV701_12356 [Chthoniobacter flavus]
MKFPPDLVGRVRSALASKGFCFLNTDEIHRLLASVSHNRTARHHAIEEFAEICGAHVETTPHLKSARFVPEAASQRDAVQSAEDLRHSVTA